jgi:UDP-arabinose 4-epimerase
VNSSTVVLVTGGAGYVGSHTAKVLSRAGYSVVVFDNLSRGHREAVRWGPLEVGDLSDTPRVREVLEQYRIGAVLHFAALAYVGESMQQPELYFRNNVSGTLSLLDAMRGAGVRRLVFSSTCAIYGTPSAVPIEESHPAAPESPYGESKRMVEQVLRWEGACHGLRSVALRYFNAAGCDADGEIGEDHSPETHLIPSLLEAAMGRRPACPIFGEDYPTPDGTCIRDYVHVTDLGAAHVLALKHLESGGESTHVNLGTGHGYSVKEILAAAEAAVGRPIPIVRQPRRPGDPPSLVAGAGRAKSLLGWEPANSSLEHILKTAWRWASRPAVSRSQAD